MSAGAYVGQNPYIVHLGGPSGNVRCDAQPRITATVRAFDTGALVAGQVITWDMQQSPTTGDSVSPTRTVTDSNGKAVVNLSFGPAEGERTVRAIIIPGWPETITVTCRGSVVTPPPTIAPTPTPQSTTPPLTPKPSDNLTPAPSTVSSPSIPTASPATSQPSNTGQPTMSVGVPTGAPGEVATPSPLSSETPNGSATPSSPGPSPAEALPSNSPGVTPPGQPSSSLDLVPIGLLGLVGAGVAGAAAFLFLRRR